MSNKTVKKALIIEYISLMPNDIFEADILTKNDIKERLELLSILEIREEILSAKRINESCSNWD